MNKIIFFILSFLFISCADQSKERYTERAAAEQHGANKAENENLASKAKQMEEELNKLHYFYSAIEGVYNGNIFLEDESYRIKLNMNRSIPEYTGTRTRQLSEIEYDLNLLSFHIQIIQWHKEDPYTAVGCRVSGIRPNILTGIITINSPDCPNVYNIFLSDIKQNYQNPSDKSAKIASDILNKKIRHAEQVVGSIQPTSNSKILNFFANRDQ